MPRSAVWEPGWGEKHSAIVKDELAIINTRREKSRQVQYDSAEKVLDVVGLTLSGGGIRSAAVGLGVLQALNHHDLLKRVDYLSTVSGGGYIGSALTATMVRAGEFVFGKTAGGTGSTRASEISDTPAVGHIRNYSNYLIPAGARDLLTGIAIVVRGLVANLSLTLPLVLLLAAVTILSNPARSCIYLANFFGFRVADDSRLFSAGSWPATFEFAIVGALAAALILLVGAVCRWLLRFDRMQFFGYLAGTALVMGVICNIGRYLPVDHFGLTLAAALLGLIVFFIWALLRSLLPVNRLQEFRGHLPTMAATYLVLLAVIGFFEFQPFMIAEMFDYAEGGGDRTAGLVGGVALAWLKWLATITAPVAAVVTAFRQQFGELLKGAAASDLASRLMAYAATVAVWVAGLALPLLIWIGYLYLCYWGIANDKVVFAADRQCQVATWDDAPFQLTASRTSDSLAGKIQFNSENKSLSAEINRQEAKPVAVQPLTVISHIPAWLLSFARPFGAPEIKHPVYVTGPASEIAKANTKQTQLGQARSVNTAWSGSKTKHGNSVNVPMAALYLLTAMVVFVASWWLRPNANSLHRLYRDRLSKAFLFNPHYYADGEPSRNEPSLDQGKDFLPLDDEKLSRLLRPGYPPANEEKLVSPYHLINAALNIQGSDFANRRGRNADFFVFSPLHIGSEATRYARTAEFEDAAPGLDLATAMAISGAAASSNMGSASIKVLAPTLALLNVRLGYWLKNPRYVGESGKPLHHSTPLYLWSEITGRLYENSEAVYLTDGGHIENLGIYELFRRRCKVIVAVDAEADPAMNFPALMTLQRYARIDLGILVDLPWTPIQLQTLDWMNVNAGKPPKTPPVASHGSHVAIGTIDYGGGQTGYLVYIKSSLTGDENDYIHDYARRNASFPHETTGDQFFSEEQFEVYRSLGFHITHGFLSDDPDADMVVVNDGKDRCVKAKFTDVARKSIRDVREALGLPLSGKLARD